ncbi:hypothetical protein SAMN05421810_104362 [Amycolatopsis arida]|uniref:Uncharacterized protein n=1 Tax=Amycolatopsis arida TaxID=587909 RepID=A0A1I5VGK8_9PSEU|nr:hypothetical protein [Amycolatopsis arida]TDX87875.1 hypothetical protein CLV69_1127 [Amycolatopsis arida]SFQ06620.1 hypothetical protein SAMN05421810_104362 [Amycolatopsis arida]
MAGGKGSWRRDFDRFGAKLEKHVERLPDYAYRAQEKLQRHLPPSSPARPGEPARPVPPSAPRLPQLSAELPVVGDLRAKWERWNDPAAKLERRKRRTSRALTLWIVLTILCGLVAVAGLTGVVGAAGAAGAEFLAGAAGMVVFGALGVRSGLRLRQLNRVELPASTAPPPLPSAGSAAREPMERLAECEASLTELLTQLDTPSAGAPASVPEVSVEEARATAREAAAALRGLAARVQAIERAMATAPAAERGPLGSAVRTLREQLDDGLTGYRGLIAAAGQAVAASSGGIQPAKEALTDATDRLAGLAIALRELS